MIIPERISFPIENLIQIAIMNAKNAGKNLKIYKQEVRSVNDNFVHLMQFDATVQGIDFTYFGYYTVGDFGAIQLLGVSPANLFQELQNDIENVLNGLIIKE